VLIADSLTGAVVVVRITVPPIHGYRISAGTQTRYATLYAIGYAAAT